MELWSTGLWPIIIYCACFLFPPALNGPSLFISPLNLEPGLTSTSSYCDGPRFSLFFFLSSVLAFLLESCSECVIFYNLIFITNHLSYIYFYIPIVYLLCFSSRVLLCRQLRIGCSPPPLQSLFSPPCSFLSFASGLHLFFSALFHSTILLLLLLLLFYYPTITIAITITTPTTAYLNSPSFTLLFPVPPFSSSPLPSTVRSPAVPPLSPG